MVLLHVMTDRSSQGMVVLIFPCEPTHYFWTYTGERIPVKGVADMEVTVNDQTAKVPMGLDDSATMWW